MRNYIQVLDTVATNADALLTTQQLKDLEDIKEILRHYHELRTAKCIHCGKHPRFGKPVKTYQLKSKGYIEVPAPNNKELEDLQHKYKDTINEKNKEYADLFKQEEFKHKPRKACAANCLECTCNK